VTKQNSRRRQGGGGKPPDKGGSERDGDKRDALHRRALGRQPSRRCQCRRRILSSSLSALHRCQSTLQGSANRCSLAPSRGSTRPTTSSSNISRSSECSSSRCSQPPRWIPSSRLPATLNRLRATCRDRPLRNQSVQTMMTSARLRQHSLDQHSNTAVVTRANERALLRRLLCNVRCRLRACGVRSCST